MSWYCLIILCFAVKFMHIYMYLGMLYKEEHKRERKKGVSWILSCCIKTLVLVDGLLSSRGMCWLMQSSNLFLCFYFSLCYGSVRSLLVVEYFTELEWMTAWDVCTVPDMRRKLGISRPQVDELHYWTPLWVWFTWRCLKFLTPKKNWFYKPWK